MEDGKNYNSECSLKNSWSFRALFNLVFCLDLQIELESWSNYSDNSKEKKSPRWKKILRSLNYLSCLSSLINSPDNCASVWEFEKGLKIWVSKKFHEHFFFSCAFKLNKMCLIYRKRKGALGESSFKKIGSYFNEG